MAPRHAFCTVGSRETELICSPVRHVPAPDGSEGDARMATSKSARCIPAQRCQAPDLLYQRFPKSGPLADTLNLDRAELIRRIGEMRGSVYCYVLTTVKDDGGELVQTGTAPNFQGELVTLCTCKGQMRAGKVVDAWQGAWIAGVAGAEAGPIGRGHLFYLMRVEWAFASHRDLWKWLRVNAPSAAQAKAADKHPLGDVYRPRDLSGGDPFDPGAYIPPRRNHPHRAGDAWHEDVNYLTHFGRRPALLVGDPHNSFLWREPLDVRVPSKFHMGRGCTIIDLEELLA